MKALSDYSFVDCILVDFTIERTATNAEIITEAYYPITINNTREKGRLKLIINSIYKINMTMNSEFKEDILKQYSGVGEDYKANEVYAIHSKVESGINYLSFKSDFLTLNLECQNINLIELD